MILQDPYELGENNHQEYQETQIHHAQLVRQDAIRRMQHNRASPGSHKCGIKRYK
jgi:hypothetical protein